MLLLLPLLLLMPVPLPVPVPVPVPVLGAVLSSHVLRVGRMQRGQVAEHSPLSYSNTIIAKETSRESLEK